MSPPPPEWLPNLLSVSSWTEDTYDNLYEIFKIDFIKSKPIYQGKKILVPREMEDGKEKIFWHITSETDISTGARIPELRRAERLLWIKAILENADAPEIVKWDHLENRNVIKTYVWLKDYDFIVILKKLKNDRRLLITAYHISYNNTKRKLLRKYERRI